ncbi:cytochrome b561 [Jannaschia seosinensis]|uniref:Cytochrome b561 n=1 Tax=Jannaschia seosinensis TaxID=313367 RepID=A0A0M7B5Y1_9RHOB|nr:cytochrome b/b6 domain-containing protein [Jannaschia seosinensis]CUH15396.1 cytochrome b561 [Jannaschia seosinensis]
MAITTGTHEAVGEDVRPAGRYHSNQIAIHWLVVSLVILQFLTGGTMAAAMEYGYDFNALPPAGVIYVHGIFGLSILTAMLVRAVLRMRHGAPEPPENESRPIQILSRSTHYAFYGVLIAMPIFGLFAVLTLNETIGLIHAWSSWLLLAIIALHVAGAFMHIFKRDGIIKRVITGQPPRID